MSHLWCTTFWQTSPFGFSLGFECAIQGAGRRRRHYNPLHPWWPLGALKLPAGSPWVKTGCWLVTLAECFTGVHHHGGAWWASQALALLAPAIPYMATHLQGPGELGGVGGGGGFNAVVDVALERQGGFVCAYQTKASPFSPPHLLFGTYAVTATPTGQTSHEVGWGTARPPSHQALGAASIPSPRCLITASLSWISPCWELVTDSPVRGGLLVAQQVCWKKRSTAGP